jgi:uroporphyrin-3 C-methyltransferase
MSEENKPGNDQRPQGLVSVGAARLAEMHEALPRNSRTLAVVALVVAVVCGALVLYMFKELQQSRTATTLGQDELSDRLTSLERVESARTTELDQARQGNAEAARQNQAIRNTLDELRTRVTRDRGDWLLSETDFLLSTANRKLRFDRDAASAIAALEEANDRLQLLNDPSLIQVRATVTRDVQALRRVPAIDRSNLAMQLSAIIEGLDDLPLAQGLATPVHNQGEEQSGRIEGWRGVLPNLWSDIKGLVRVHRLEEPVLPLLPPEQRFFLRQNLSLKLETARAALLQKDAGTWRASLTEAQAWLGRYYDGSTPAVRSALETVTKLRAIDVAPPLPDIGESLRQLRRIKRQLDAEVSGEGDR